jgi:Protein of unknown function (DUF3313)
MRIAILLLAALALAGCGSSRPVRDVQPQGFLGDCSQLTSGGEGEAGCDTSTPTSSGPSYDKVIVAPVSRSGNRRLRPISPRRISRPPPTTSTRSCATSWARISGGTRYAPRRGGADRRQRGQSEDGRGKRRGADRRRISGAYDYVTGEPTVQGEAAVEARITDAPSGEVLAAGVDRRMGGRSLSSATTEWTDVNNILVYWAQQTRFRLCGLQERTGCERPQTSGL